MGDAWLGLALAAMLLSAATFDLYFRRIPNWLTGAGVVFGIAFHTWVGGLNGLWHSAQGGFVGFSLFIIFFLVGAMGGGDVKLMTAVGALKGPMFTLSATYYTAVVGGIMAFSVMIWHGSLLSNLKKAGLYIRSPRNSDGYKIPPEESNPEQIPYGLAISVGGVWALLTS